MTAISQLIWWERQMTFITLLWIHILYFLGMMRQLWKLLGKCTRYIVMMQKYLTHIHKEYLKKSWRIISRNTKKNQTVKVVWKISIESLRKRYLNLKKSRRVKMRMSIQNHGSSLKNLQATQLSAKNAVGVRLNMPRTMRPQQCHGIKSQQNLVTLMSRDFIMSRFLKIT